MDWRLVYKEKITTPDEAAKLIHSGDTITFNGSGCTPMGVLEEIFKRYRELENVHLCHPTAWGDFPYGKPEYKGSFRNKALFLSANVRKAWEEGWGVDYIPSNLSELSNLFSSKSISSDVVILNVSEPDSEGCCSAGPYIAHLNKALEEAKLVIGQINSHVPNVQGSQIHLDHIDILVEKHQPLIEVQPVQAGEIEKQIAEHIETLIKDGDTLQFGRGSIPQAIVEALENKKDLGVHSELISDGIVDLTEKGVITGKRKSHMPETIVASLGDGSKRFYDFVDNNPAVLFKPADYVNNPRIIAKNKNMVSINSALQVDLSGQINAESIGSRLMSGTGGQMDFAIGSRWSENGRYIVALPSTAKQGEVSRIVPLMDKGTAVTVPRTLADIIVTEYGVAHLRGKSLDERAESLIQIAHPKFREDMINQAARHLNIHSVQV